MSEPIKKYRDKNVVNMQTKKIKTLAEKSNETIRIMHVCGTYEHDLVKAGLC
jgi:hydrogenase expression/formation protein HypD